jgi:predicted transcriptional regulator
MNLNRLKHYIDHSNYTIRTFCKEAGIKTPTLYKAIKDNDIRASVLEKMCILLKVSPAEFFNLGEEMQERVMFSKKVVSEPEAEYKKKLDIHMGKIIEARLDEIGMTIAEFGRRIGTSRQNAQNMLKRKQIQLESAIQYNEILNPPNSKPWDIFEYFLRKKPESIEDKYSNLLEEHNKLLSKSIAKNKDKK